MTTQEYPLDRLIRFLNPKEGAINYKKEKVVHILVRTGEILPYRSVSSRLRNVKSYVVNRENTAEHETKCVVNDVANDRKITLIIKYKIRCFREKKEVPKNQYGKRLWNYFTKSARQRLRAYQINYEKGFEDQIVQALYKETHPALSLHKLIEIWIRAYREKVGDKDFILKFFNIRNDIKDLLVDKVANEVGAYFIPRIKLELEDDWEPIPIISDNFPVYLKNGDDRVNVKFKTELYRDTEPDRRIYALSRRHRLPKIEGWMPGRIAAFFNTDCVLHEFFFRPRRLLRQKIINHLNTTLLKDEGRHMTSLVLETKFEFDPPNPMVTDDFEVEIDVEGEHNTVKFVYRLVMVLQDLDIFRSFKLPDFKAWLTSRLTFVTKSNFHSKTYTDHLMEFASNQKEIEDNIKTEVSRWAELVGYSLKEINIITNFENLRYKEGYRFEVEAKEVLFATQNNRIKVKVNFTVQGSIRNMYAMAKDVSWRFKNDVQAAVKEYLQEGLKKKIKTSAPEKFYSHIFNYENPLGGLAILKELRMEVVTILELWDTKNIKIQISLSDTEPVKRIKALRKSPCPFKVTVFPYHLEGYGEEIVFDGKFIIIGICEAYWSVFDARDYEESSKEIGAIADYLNDRISREFNTIERERLEISHKEELPEINSVLETTVKRVEEVFGVTIRVVHFNRCPILSEKVAFNQQKIFTRITTWVNGVKKNILNGKKGDPASR